MNQILSRNRSRVTAPLLGLAFVLLFVLLPGALFGDLLRSLVSFRQVDDYPLYVMHIYGDYGFDHPGVEGGQACSVFAALDPGSDQLLGRNFDWFNRPSLLLFTHPRQGYASVSMVDISYLGFGTEKLSWSDRLRLMEAPSLPFDGMNEAGLAVGMMAVPEAQATNDPRKVTLDSLQIIRLVLDHAASVDEALSLFEAYNVDWGSGPPLHYLVADVGGNSAVIEFVGGEMSVLRNEQPWQVATNFVISGKSPAEARALCPRYRRASDVLQQARGSLSPDEAMSLLDQVSQEITMWSVVYDMSSGQVTVAMGRDYGDVHRLKLGMK